MRKSVLAIAAAGGVFALTGAAASSWIVSGPLNPRTGSDSRTCDLGAITVTTLDNGTSLTGFTVASTIAANGQECTGATVYVAIDDTLAPALPSGWNAATSTVIGAAGDAGDWRFSAPATSFTSGSGNAVTFKFDLAASNNIYGWQPPAVGSSEFTLQPIGIAEAPNIAAVGVGTASVLLSQSEPSTGAFLTPFQELSM